MNNKYLLKITCLIIISYFALVRTQFTKCDEIKSFLSGKRAVYVEKCKVDDEGNVDNLQLEYNTADDDALNYILDNYRNLTTFGYSYKAGVDYDIEDIFGSGSGEPEYPKDIAKLEKLRHLKIFYHFHRNNADYLFLPKGLRTLAIRNVAFTNENIQEIATLKKLRKLDIDNNFIHKEYKYNNFQDFYFLKSLTISNKGDIIDNIKVSREFLQNFNQIEVFQYSLVRLVKANIKNVLAELPYLKEFRIVDCECSDDVTIKYIARTLGDNINLVIKNTYCKKTMESDWENL